MKNQIAFKKTKPFWKSPLFLLLIALALGIFYYFAGPPTLIPQARNNFVVGLKDNNAKVIKTLEEKGYIRNLKFFTNLVGNKQITPGLYFISPNMNAFQLVDVLVSSCQGKWVVVPEGQRKEEIASTLRKNLNWNSDQEKEFIQKAQEGYLFPDSYLILNDSTPDKVIMKLVDNFNEKTAKVDFGNRKKEILTMASLVQREAGNDYEMATVAGVINNRIKIRMPLGIDAAIQYILGNEENWWPVIKSSDRKVTSPFNTYTNKGLPPHPICNPGIAAIKAAANPEQTPYFYYIHDKNHVVHWATTFEEHKANIEQYLR